MSKSAGTEYELPYWRKGQFIAGTDEVGRGCLAGPVVAAAVILPETVSVDKGIYDSKKKSPEEREYLAEYIRSIALAIEITFLDNTIIDTLNIRQAALKAMQMSVDSLRIKPHHILVDGNYFIHDSIPFTTIIGGDGISISIAAASIIAKVERDKWMTEIAHHLHPQYGFEKHKGYATKTHLEALATHGESPIHRKTFLKKFRNRQEKLFNL